MNPLNPMRISLFAIIALAASILWAECTLCQPNAATRAAISPITQANIAMAGVWQSNCYQVERAAAPLFNQDTYTFSATGSFSLETNHFTDANCQEYLRGSNFYGTFQLGEKTETLGGESARTLHMLIDNADWPEGVANEVNWIIVLQQDQFRFGSLNPPFNWVNNGVVFQKLKGQGPMVF